MTIAGRTRAATPSARAPRHPRPPVATTVAAALALGLGLTLGSGASMAADPPPGGPAGRYSMAPADGGFVRLDTLTGAMAICKRSGADWSCEDMRDASTTLRAENDRLIAENKTLKEENRRLEETLLGPDTNAGAKPGAGTGPALKLPSEQDVDRAFSYLQGMLKKFREKLDELEKSPRDNKGTPL